MKKLKPSEAAALAGFDSLPDSARVSLPVVATVEGISPATVWRRVKSGHLPAPVKTGPSTTRWIVGDLRLKRAERSAL